MIERFFYLSGSDFRLLFRDGSNRASACTGTTADTSILVDFELPITFCDSAYRTLCCTSTTGNTRITDYICHNFILLIYGYQVILLIPFNQ